MKKILFLFAALAGLALFQGCATHYRASYVVTDYDERCWYGDHWVYRFHDGDRVIYRRWHNNSWIEERNEGAFWLRQKWVKKSRSERDDGRRYDDDDRDGGKSGERHDNSGRNRHK